MDRIPIIPSAVTFAFWGAILGLVLGFIYAIGGFFLDLLTIGLNQGSFLALFALIGMPLIGSIAAFCLGLTFAIIYNMIAFLFDQ